MKASSPSPNTGKGSEEQIYSLEKRREKLNLNFAKKCLKIDKMKVLFPMSSKNHEMKTRDIKKYKVNKAKKERRKNSSVIYMQKLLNNHVVKKYSSCYKGTVHKLVQNP